MLFSLLMRTWINIYLSVQVRIDGTGEHHLDRGSIIEAAPVMIAQQLPGAEKRAGFKSIGCV